MQDLQQPHQPDEKNLWQPIFPGGMKGMANLGNTCFINAAMQCLSKAEPLIEYFLNRRFEEDIKNKYIITPNRTNAMIGNAFFDTIIKLWDPKDQGSVVPRPLIGILSSQGINQQFRHGRQNDSHELLVFLLECLHNCLRIEVKVNINVDGTITDDLNRRVLQGYKHLERHLKTFKMSIVTQTFAGQHESATTCKNCSNISRTYDVFETVSLPITEKCSTVYDCMDVFTDHEVLEGENMYNCDNCKKTSNATKHITFWSMPKILIIHFKRFNLVQDGKQSRWQKNDSMIDFPINNLNLMKYKNIEPANMKELELYDLFGVVAHTGGLHGGHYIAHTKHPIDGKWSTFNDTGVRPITDPAQIVNNSAYILFYQKKIVE